MSYSAIQKLQITNEVTEWQLRINTTAKGMGHGTQRLGKLSTQGFYIECLIVDAQITEHSIKFILAGYATKRRILNILNEPDQFKEIKLDDIEDEMLGTLIGKLKKFTGETALTEKLWRLNNLRKETIHHLFSGNKDLEKLDEEARSFIASELIVIISEIQTLANKVNKEINEIVAQINDSP